MSFANKPLPLPMKESSARLKSGSLPIKDNMEDISLQSRLKSTHSTYNPSPLKNQVARSLSTHSKASNASTNSNDSQYFIHVNKTPSNLTPSQRLKQRRDQLNYSISQFKIDQFPMDATMKSKPVVYRYDSDDDDDLEIDSNMAIFNVPISQPLTSIANNEKYTFTNSDRKLSINTDSTRTSSVFESTNDTSFEFSSRDSNKTNSVISNSSFLSQSDIKDLTASTDALELTLLFNQSEYTQIHEEARQKRTMLANFKKINQSLPQNLNDSSTSISTPPKFPPPAPLRYTKSSGYLPQSKPEPVQQRHSTTSVPTETSKYVSFTRPTWLPPKSPHDKEKHQKQSENILNRAVIDENHRHMKKLAHLNKLENLKQKDAKIWESEVLSTNSKAYQEKIRTKQVKQMYWRGLPENLRSRIWWRQLGKSINLNELTAESYFNKYHSFKKMMNQYTHLLKENEKLQLKKLVHTHPDIVDMKMLYDRVTEDLMDTYPDMDYFQQHETTEMLREVIISFIIYMNETINKHKFDDGHFISAYYFTGLNNLAAIMFYSYKNSYMTFTSLCNMFTKNNLLNILITHQAEPHELSKSILESLLDDKFTNNFEKKFQKDLNRLYTHFKIIRLTPMEYLPNLLLSLFTNLFNFELSNHCFDIWVFESDEFLLRCLLGLFNQISHKLFGSKQEILQLFGENNRRILNKDIATSKDIYRYLNVGYEYNFIESVQKF